MLTKDDLKVLQGVIFALEDLEVDNYIINDLVEIYNKCIDIKRKAANKSNEYNKEHKKYHYLSNQLYYHRKKGNQSKVKELEEKINNIKNSTI